MTTRRNVTLALALATVAAAGEAGAQTASSFEELRLILRAGDTVSVVDDAGDTHTGRIVNLSASTLVLQGFGARQNLGPGNVRMIRQQLHDPVYNGAAIGGGLGAISMLLFAAAITEGDIRPGGERAVARAMLLPAGLGAGIGAGVDALRHESRTVYRRRGATRRSLTIAPLISAERRGVAVSFGF